MAPWSCNSGNCSVQLAACVGAIVIVIVLVGLCDCMCVCVPADSGAHLKPG